MLPVLYASRAVIVGFGIRGGVLVIVHIVCRGRRWCKARKETFRTVDVPLLWLDAALTVWSRKSIGAAGAGGMSAVAADLMLATLAHDVFLHCPVVFFVQAMERHQWWLAGCLCALALVTRATLSLFYGHVYTALALLSLRHVWLGLGAMTLPRVVPKHLPSVV